jgi:8-oxo-dGTP pyrophosphatase MutT (NUDIX family)
VRPLDHEALRRLEALLASRAADRIEPGNLRRACVLVPLIVTDEGWSMVFVLRSENLKRHSGQIAFPGGGADPGEPLEVTALRETEEEIGVARDDVRLIGRLDDLVTRTGFVVAPFVGVIDAGHTYVPQEREVTEIFEVPVAPLFAPPNPEIRYIPYLGELYPSYFYHWGGREIWGLTGRMLKSFLDLVRLSL